MEFNFEKDESGIHSLAGFSYQIKVLVLYLASLKENMQIEFENIDDVNLKKIKSHTELDEFEDSLGTTICGEDYQVIQVKRTKISKDSFRKVLLNWIILEYKNLNITKYTLFTDEKFKNKNLIFDIEAKDLFDYIKKSNPKSKISLLYKAKSLINKDFRKFEEVFNSINSKHTFRSTTDLDLEIEESFKTYLRRTEDNEDLFKQRIKALHMDITVKIMEEVLKGNGYSISYDSFMKKLDEITMKINEKNRIYDYVEFKNCFPIDLQSEEICTSREYKQLEYCKLQNDTFEQFLMYKQYYGHCKMLYLESTNESIITNIEQTTYDNYRLVMEEIRDTNSDTPKNRLMQTRREPNNYAKNNEIKYGSVIYLTKRGINNQISWKDD